jgi:trk system potassium uptake protein TrkA
MRVVIVGCGRLGSLLGDRLSAADHRVTMADINPRAFELARMRGTVAEGPRLTLTIGDGTDRAVLERLGAMECDVLIAATEGDNRNLMIAQIASLIFSVPQVFARVNDPVRAELFGNGKIVTLSPGWLLANAILRTAGDDGKEELIREPEMLADYVHLKIAASRRARRGPARCAVPRDVEERPGR